MLMRNGSEGIAQETHCVSPLVPGASPPDAASTIVLLCPDTDTKFGVALSDAVAVGMPPRAPPTASGAPGVASPVHASSLLWLPGGLVLMVTVGGGGLAAITRWGALVQLSPSIPLDRIPLGVGGPSSGGGALAASTSSSSASCHLPLDGLLRRVRDGKLGPTMGAGVAASLALHASGTKLLLSDGAAFMELTLPRCPTGFCRRSGRHTAHF